MESRESVDFDLTRYLLILKRRWMSVSSIFLLTVAISYVATTFMKPSYQAEGKLLFRIPSFGSNLLLSSPEGQTTGDLRTLVATQNPISTQIEVISSPSLLQQTIKELKLKNNKGEPLKVEVLEQGLTLKIVGGTDVLRVTYKSRNPNEAAAVVNQIMNLYLKSDIITSRFEAEETQRLLDKQLPKAQAGVHDTQVALRSFKQKNNVVDLSEESKSAVAIIGNLNTEINNVQAQLDEVTAQTNALRQKVNLNSQKATDLIALNQSPAVQAILTQIQEVDRKLAIERSRFLDRTPIIVDLEANKANLQALLQKQVEQSTGNKTKVPQRLLQIGELRQSLIKDFQQSETQRLGLTKKLASLYNSLSTYQSRVKSLPLLVQNQRELEQKAEFAQSNYQILLKKVQELQVAANKNTANARIITQAIVPEEATLSQKPIVLALGMMLGLFLSTTTVLLIEMRDKSLKTLKEIREIFGYTMLGIVPLLPKKVSTHRYVESTPPEIAVRDMPHSLTSEIYRMIQANLRFLSSDKVLKTIVVTSAVPKEGKSTVSANLAAAIAQLGRQVLLIDADMRVPSQHYLWQLTNTAGLSEVLVGQAEFKTGVCKVMDNLDVLTAGVKPPNPLALLDSKRMASLIENFADQYDFVIIDAPPLLLAADALTLSHMTDGILLVARPGVIDSSSASAAKEMLESSDHNILGLLVNGIIEKNESNNYFYHPKEYFSAEKVSEEGSYAHGRSNN
ncbi:MAG: polysaccharide biosynthesis tyrosine autokinase [Rhizonema sp. NSF051]|nr:polysaccharide biosynthesis tyrosine autokinase [Rhizonema sp. NSF051]